MPYHFITIYRVRSLSHVLLDVEAEVLPGLDAKHKNEQQEIIHHCDDILNQLQKLLGKYSKLKSDSKDVREQVKRIWKRIQWEPEDIKELRSRIASNVAVLNTFQATVMRYFTTSYESFRLT